MSSVKGRERQIDRWTSEGRFVSRRLATKAIVGFYNEPENTMRFHEMLGKRRKESAEHPERLVPLKKIN